MIITYKQLPVQAFILNNFFTKVTGYDPVFTGLESVVFSICHYTFKHTEDVGFEPTRAFTPLLVFKTSLFNHLSNLP